LRCSPGRHLAADIFAAEDVLENPVLHIPVESGRQGRYQRRESRRNLVLIQTKLRTELLCSAVALRAQNRVENVHTDLHLPMKRARGPAS